METITGRPRSPGAALGTSQCGADSLRDCPQIIAQSRHSKHGDSPALPQTRTTHSRLLSQRTWDTVRHGETILHAEWSKEARELSREPGMAHFPESQDMPVMDTLRYVSTHVSILKQKINKKGYKKSF